MRKLKDNLKGSISGCINIPDFQIKHNVEGLSLSFGNFTLSLCMPVPSKKNPNPTWVANISCTCRGEVNVGRFKGFKFTHNPAIGIPLPAE